jgi:hypothetical protein
MLKYLKIPSGVWYGSAVIHIDSPNCCRGRGFEFFFGVLYDYPLDRNFGIPGPFGHGNRLPTCKYLAMQPQLCRGGLGAL